MTSKKTLVVSTWAPDSTGGPLNLHNMLSQLPADSYCILTRHKTMRLDPSRPKLQGKCYFCDRQENKAELQRSVSSRAQHRDTPLSANVVHRNAPPFLKVGIRQARQAAHDLLTIVQMIRVGLRVAKEEQIEKLVGVSDEGPALVATFLISLIAGVPYALYLFDIYLGNNLSLVEYALAKIFEPLLFKHASVIIVTNEGTEQFYRSRYGDRFHSLVLPNSVFPEQYERYRSTYNPREPFNVVFTGYVYWPQERALMNLIKSLEYMKDLRIILSFYVPNIPESIKLLIANNRNVQVISPVQSEMPVIQCNATILFLPLSWHSKSPQVIATATPGKLTDYMAAGRPILIHAPPYAYVTQYAKQNELAHTVDQEDPAKLARAIRELATDVSYSHRLIANALRTYYRYHDARVTARRFAEVIASI